MRQKWLSLLLVCRMPKIGQHTGDPVSYCRCCFFSPSIPANRPKQPRLKGTSSSAGRRGGDPFCRQTRRKSPSAWAPWADWLAQAVTNRISSVLANFWYLADEEE